MESYSPHPPAEKAQTYGRLAQAEGPEGPIAPVVTTGTYTQKKTRATCQHDVGVPLLDVSWIPLASSSGYQLTFWLRPTMMPGILGLPAAAGKNTPCRPNS